MVPMGMWSHIDAFKTAFGDGNIEKSRELLASRGYSESKKFTFDLWYTPSHYGDTEVDMAAVLKDQLEATEMMIVNVKSAEWATYRDNWKNKVMPAYLLGWYPDYIDPDNYTVAFASTAGSKGIGIHFSDPVWDKKFVEGQTVTDLEKRIAIYQDIQRMWTEDVPTAPIFQGMLYVFAQNHIRGILLSPTLQFNYGPIYRVK
jgi:peptide/nickel transport system substrate-binding protein